MRTWRTIEVYKDKALSGDSGKETFALPRTHMIGDLWLAVRAKNTTTGNVCDGAAYDGIEASLDNITIKSGSKVYKGFDGITARRMAALADGRVAPEIADHGDSVEQETIFPIHFGIEPQDEDVILPAPLMDSLDMVLEYSFPTTAAAGFVTGNKEFDLYANVLEPTADLEEKKILIQEKKQDFTPAGAGTLPFDLTLDERRVLRKVYVDAYVTAQKEGYVLSDLKIKADNEEVIAGKWRNIQFQNAVDARLNYYRTMTTQQVAAGDVYRSRIPDVIANATSDGTTDEGSLTFSGDAITIVAGAADDINHYWMYSPVLPAMAVLDFDRDNSLRRLQPQGIRDLDLVVTDSAAGAASIYEESLQKFW